MRYVLREFAGRDSIRTSSGPLEPFVESFVWARMALRRAFWSSFCIVVHGSVRGTQRSL